MRAEDAQGTPAQSRTSPRILVYKKWLARRKVASQETEDANTPPTHTCLGMTTHTSISDAIIYDL